MPTILGFIVYGFSKKSKTVCRHSLFIGWHCPPGIFSGATGVSPVLYRLKPMGAAAGGDARPTTKNEKPKTKNGFSPIHVRQHDVHGADHGDHVR
jgi:hypothetical protein